MKLIAAAPDCAIFIFLVTKLQNYNNIKNITTSLSKQAL